MSVSLNTDLKDGRSEVTMVTSDTAFLALVGPTCIGKTRYAHDLIEEFPLELINLDSFQVHSFFRVGTGLADLQAGRAHLYGFRDPHDILSPRQYLSLVDGVLKGISANNHYPLFEGGSISYIKALLERYALKLIGLRPADTAHAVDLIERRMGSRSEALLISEITEGLRRGFRDTVIMRDDVVYLPYVEYLAGSISLPDARGRVVKNLLRRYQTQMEEYSALPVEWFIPSDASLSEIRDLIRGFLEQKAF